MSEYTTAIAERKLFKQQFSRLSTSIASYIGGQWNKEKIADLSGDLAVIYEECLEANDVVMANATDDLLERAQHWKTTHDGTYREIVQSMKTYMKTPNTPFFVTEETNRAPNNTTEEGADL